MPPAGGHAGGADWRHERAWPWEHLLVHRAARARHAPAGGGGPGGGAAGCCGDGPAPAPPARRDGAARGGQHDKPGCHVQDAARARAAVRRGGQRPGGGEHAQERSVQPESAARAHGHADAPHERRRGHHVHTRHGVLRAGDRLHGQRHGGGQAAVHAQRHERRAHQAGDARQAPRRPRQHHLRPRRALDAVYQVGAVKRHMQGLAIALWRRRRPLDGRRRRHVRG
mmetsp:Transcript_273/g.886  ORF Transcript_273/g.886 Transcript_273/m.886 type:complete len:226 (-) Transcript_273:159-836(-)